VCGLALAAGFAAVLPGPAHAQELFSWWRRGLLPLELTPGAWVRLERLEAAEGRVETDTLDCAVRAAQPDGTRWVELRVRSETESWIFQLDPSRLRADVDLLDAVLELYRLPGDGSAQAQDLAQLRNNRLVRRHFQDIFTSPQLTRSTLPDTTWSGGRLAREEVVLSETREQRVPMGRRTLIHRTVARSQAQISAQVPVFHLLGATTTTRVETAVDPPEPNRRAPPPLIALLQLRCLAFGTDGATALPRAVLAARAGKR
jgi:hypothetical protein